MVAVPCDGRWLGARARESGSTLLEVLISIVISSVALLALAGSSASALRYTKMSQYRATATLLAGDLAERMRANKGQAAREETAASGFFAGAYDFNATSFARQATNANFPAELCNTAASSCTPAQIAELDMAQWRLLVRTQLPEGSVFVSRQEDAIAADVWMAWRDPAVASSDEAPMLAAECPSGLGTRSDKSVRCSYFRINL
ncbi:type IV pilus modification protein PilV [Polaromonas sp.]|uniref:type IV pilus modification protein PilV n=1 Tax=Polaromonas sp. TaxID=1869339 RepID=UPI003265B48D